MDYDCDLEDFDYYLFIVMMMMRLDYYWIYADVCCDEAEDGCMKKKLMNE